MNKSKKKYYKRKTSKNKIHKRKTVKNKIRNKTNQRGGVLELVRGLLTLGAGVNQLRVKPHANQDKLPIATKIETPPPHATPATINNSNNVPEAVVVPHAEVVSHAALVTKNTTKSPVNKLPTEQDTSNDNNRETQSDYNSDRADNNKFIEYDTIIEQYYKVIKQLQDLYNEVRKRHYKPFNMLNKKKVTMEIKKIKACLADETTFIKSPSGNKYYILNSGGQDEAVYSTPSINTCSVEYKDDVDIEDSSLRTGDELVGIDVYITIENHITGKPINNVDELTEYINSQQNMNQMRDGNKDRLVLRLHRMVWSFNGKELTDNQHIELIKYMRNKFAPPLEESPTELDTSTDNNAKTQSGDNIKVPNVDILDYSALTPELKNEWDDAVKKIATNQTDPGIIFADLIEIKKKDYNNGELNKNQDKRIDEAVKTIKHFGATSSEIKEFSEYMNTLEVLANTYLQQKKRDQYNYEDYLYQKNSVPNDYNKSTSQNLQTPDNTISHSIIAADDKYRINDEMLEHKKRYKELKETKNELIALPTTDNTKSKKLYQIAIDIDNEEKRHEDALAAFGTAGEAALEEERNVKNALKELDRTGEARLDGVTYVKKPTDPQKKKANVEPAFRTIYYPRNSTKIGKSKAGIKESVAGGGKRKNLTRKHKKKSKKNYKKFSKTKISRKRKIKTHRK
jgi:hypothetical protein